MVKHLSACVSPVKRRDHKKYMFPTTPEGREWCPLCRKSAKDNFTMGYHILARHEEERDELWAWGFDLDLL